MGTLVTTKGSTLPTLPSLFTDLLSPNLFDWPVTNVNGNGTLPAVNFMETDESYLVEVAAPGMHKKDFSVELDNNLLRISATRKGSKDNPNYLRREFNYYSFERTFNLSENMVLVDKITAKYNDGILLVTIPKSERAKVKHRKIAIN